MAQATVIFERDDRVFLVGAVAPVTGKLEEETASVEDIRRTAPNENLLWLRGSYVEADRPNRNGAEWSAEELSIASLTPRLMPVTVMHDPSTAVGMIADQRLLTPKADGVPRARIDTTLGIWAHRFPDAAHEALTNYEQGGLMQSMECRPGFYDCGSCGLRYPNLAGQERANWCDCLNEKRASRRLGGVVFTGTGLIFASRGAEGAYPDAHLSFIQDEVAEFHARALHDTHRPRRKKNSMEITDKEYGELVAAREKLTALEPKHDELAAKVPELEKDNERLETELKSTQKTRDEEKAKREQLEEKARRATLAGERKSKLGAGFMSKLGERTRSRIEEQAASMSDEDWKDRVAELEEMAGVKADAASDEDEEPVFTAEELARAGGSRTSTGTPGEPSPAAKEVVLGGLLKVL